jgi:hypothetical protein
MGKHVQWVTHKGVRILFVNAAGLKEAEYIAALEEAKQEGLKDRASLLVLMDLSNTSGDQQWSVHVFTSSESME